MACVLCWIDCIWTLILPWRFLFCSFAFKHAWSPPYGPSFRCRWEWLQWLMAWFNISTLPFICRSMMWSTNPYSSRVTTVIPHWPFSLGTVTAPFNVSLRAQKQEMHHTIFNWVLCEGDGLLPSEVSEVDLFSINIFSAHIKPPLLVSASLS